MKWHEKELMRINPHMKCANTTEFKQRLQWLSEGMLRNHMESVIDYKPCKVEMEQYKTYRRLFPK